MSGLAESAQRCNQLCDQHSERYLNTAVGKFPAAEIRAALDKLKRQGFVVRLKTAKEIIADVEAYKLAHGLPRKQRRVHTNFYTDPQRRKLVDNVHALLIPGRPTHEACKLAGVNYRSFIAWRSRYNIKTPVLPGRQDIKQKRGEG